MKKYTIQIGTVSVTIMLQDCPRLGEDVVYEGDNYTVTGVWHQQEQPTLIWVQKN